MNRNEEYLTLLETLDNAPLPARLSGSVERARRRARRHQLSRSLGATLASLGGLAAAFALAVNLSIPFAMACKSLPILKDLAAAVALSPSLKAAVEREYIQYVGQERTVNGVTLKLEYLILDQMQINFFCTVSGEGYDSYFLSPDLSRADGGEMEGFGLSSTSFQPGELGGFSATFELGVVPPEELVLTCEVTGHRRTGDAPAIPLDVPAAAHHDVEPEKVGSFTFPLTLDTRLLGPGRTIQVGKWVEIDSQRLCIESLDVSLTQARLVVSSHENNTAWCEGLNFYLTDGGGARYDSGSWASTGSSLVASGDDRDSGQVTYFLESPYFSPSRDLTLHITAAHWLEKDPETRLVEIDLKDATAKALPEGIRLEAVERDGDRLHLVLSTPLEEPHRQRFSWTYWDGAGQERHFTSGGHSTDEEAGRMTEDFFLEGYPYDSITLELNYSAVTRLEPPLAVELE